MVLQNMNAFILVIIIITVLATAISLFFKLRYVVVAYVVGNIVFFSYLSGGGQAGGYFVILSQFPALITSIIGVSIGQLLKPIIGRKLSKTGDSFFNRLLSRSDLSPGLNLDGTPKACQKNNSGIQLVNKEETPDKQIDEQDK